MKNALFLVLSLSPLAASANMVCRSGGPGDVYVAVFPSATKVILSTESIRGPKPLATLNCMDLPAPGTPIPEQALPFKACRQPGNPDGGYLLTLSNGGFAGIIEAKLQEETFAGPQFVATLFCSAN